MVIVNYLIHFFIKYSLFLHTQVPVLDNYLSHCGYKHGSVCTMYMGTHLKYNLCIWNREKRQSISILMLTSHIIHRAGKSLGGWSLGRKQSYTFRLKIKPWAVKVDKTLMSSSSIPLLWQWHTTNIFFIQASMCIIVYTCTQLHLHIGYLQTCT